MKMWVGFILAILSLLTLITMPITVYLAVFNTSPEYIRIAIYNIFLFWYSAHIATGLVGGKNGKSV